MPDVLAERGRDLAQGRIADLVAVLVVDRLEVVEVDHDERAAGRQRSADDGEPVGEVGEQRTAVRQIRQRVGERHLVHLLEQHGVA